MDMKRASRILALVIWACSLAAVVVLSLLPGPGTPPPFPHVDKLGHLLAYAWLGLLPWWVFNTPRAVRLTGGCVVALGCLIELAQGTIPGRMPSGLDIAANTLGVLLGIVLGRRLRAIRR